MHQKEGDKFKWSTIEGQGHSVQMKGQIRWLFDRTSFQRKTIRFYDLTLTFIVLQGQGSRSWSQQVIYKREVSKIKDRNKAQNAMFSRFWLWPSRSGIKVRSLKSLFDCSRHMPSISLKSVHKKEFSWICCTLYDLQSILSDLEDLAQKLREIHQTKDERPYHMNQWNTPYAMSGTRSPNLTRSLP